MDDLIFEWTDGPCDYDFDLALDDFREGKAYEDHLNELANLANQMGVCSDEIMEMFR